MKKGDRTGNCILDKNIYRAGFLGDVNGRNLIDFTGVIPIALCEDPVQNFFYPLI